MFSRCNSVDNDVITYVNPFIGTGGHGHTFPGSTLPFGMVQLSPDTRIDGWDGCSGYHYSDSVIYGFSHTHLSGTGIGDYCDLLVMPFCGPTTFENGYPSTKSINYSSSFNKESEKASPGFYEVVLDKHNISCRLTTTNRVGIHEYTFSDTSNYPSIMIDLEHRDELLDWKIYKSSPKELSGFRISRSWAQEQYFYFCMQFSSDFDLVYNKVENPTKACVLLQNLLSNKVEVKVGVSSVSETNARNNLNNEASSWGFDNYHKNAEAEWRKSLSKIIIESKDEKAKEIFYTSLYHTMIAPNLLSDQNGEYRGTDLKIHHSDLPVYTVFSLWDTFRSAHPLYNLIERDKTASFLRTFLTQYKDGGQLPIWELCANYTGCMIGYHVVSVILDAYVKGVESPLYEQLYEAMKHVSNRNELGISDFKNNGYISAFAEPESVSKTLEYAYNDWCIAQMALILKDTLAYENYLHRAQFYKNIYNAKSGFMQPKTNGGWKQGFVPSEVNYNYTEANAWQYSFFVPHDIYGLVEMHGGEEVFEKRLDSLFTVNSDLIGRQQADITGMIGQYAHGNEPSHHMAYLYNMIGKSYKSQSMVNKILNEQYSNEPDGIAGNEDCGQMSAWYVLSSIGLYDVNPGDPYYIIQTPLFEETVIHLENGNEFKIKSKGSSSKAAIYVKNAWLNGLQLDRNFISITDILAGGELLIEKSVNPNYDWASTNYYRTSIDSLLNITIVPRIKASSITFSDSMELSIECDNCDRIYYKLSKDTDFKIYNTSFFINNSDSVSAYAVRNKVISKIEKAGFLKFNKQRTIHLQTAFSNQYNAGGAQALVDGMQGPNNYLTGLWQGFYGDDFEAVIDLHEKEEINSITVGAIQDAKSWIWLPKYVEFYTSMDGVDYNLLKTVNHSISDRLDHSVVNYFECVTKKSITANYVKIKAPNYGVCPDWHMGKGGTSWLFFDEILIQ